MRPMLVSFLAATLLAPSAASALEADRAPDAEREVAALEMRLAELLNEGRIDEYGTWLAEDFVGLGGDGRVARGKAEQLAQLRAMKPGSRAVPQDLRVRVYGDAAVATFELARAGADGKAVPFSRLTKVFVRRDGRWYLVSLHGTRLG